MGLDFGFNKARKYKNATVDDVYSVNRYYDWKKWNSENYTLEQYLDSFNDGRKLPDEDVIEFYMKEIEENGESYINIGNICGWDNTYITEYTTDVLDKIGDDLYGVKTQEEVKKLLEITNKELEKHELIPVYVKGGVCKKKNGENAVVELAKLIVSPEDDEDMEQLFDLNDYTTIYLPKKGFDEYKRGALESFRDALLEIRKIDLDKNLVWFYVSY